MRGRELPERGVRWFDDVQQTRSWLAHPIGTIRKYADDRSSALAGVVTFHLFLGLLPLLVVMLTVFARLAEGSDNIRDAILDSTLAQLPVLGPRFDDQLDALSGSNPWVVISVLGLLWTSTGIYNSLQLALNQVWNVRGRDRHPATRRRRGPLWERRVRRCRVALDQPARTLRPVRERVGRCQRAPLVAATNHAVAAHRGRP